MQEITVRLSEKAHGRLEAIRKQLGVRSDAEAIRAMIARWEVDPPIVRLIQHAAGLLEAAQDTKDLRLVALIEPVTREIRRGMELGLDRMTAEDSP